MGYLFIRYRDLIVPREPFNGVRVVTELLFHPDEDDWFTRAEVEDFAYPLFHVS